MHFKFLGPIIIPAVCLFSISAFYCRPSDKAESVDKSLRLVATYSLQIEEPSGITFNEDKNAYWIVDGNSQVIYKTDLKGKILERLAYQGNDLEGIYYDRNNPSLWIVEERSREILQLDLKGNEIARFTVNIKGKKNKGLEGISFDNTKKAYVVNEKQPAAVIALNSDFSLSRQYDLDFADDISDLFYDGKDFYILSDESQAIFIWNPKDGLKKKFLLPFDKAEGIVVDHEKKKIVLVNDSTNKMYEFEYR